MENTSPNENEPYAIEEEQVLRQKMLFPEMETQKHTVFTKVANILNHCSPNNVRHFICDNIASFYIYAYIIALTIYSLSIDMYDEKNTWVWLLIGLSDYFAVKACLDSIATYRSCIKALQLFASSEKEAHDIFQQAIDEDEWCRISTIAGLEVAAKEVGAVAELKEFKKTQMSIGDICSALWKDMKSLFCRIQTH